MSSALAMILAAGMVLPANGPKKVAGETVQELNLSGEWEGVRYDSVCTGGIPIRAKLESGTFCYRLAWKKSFFSLGKFHDEGEGKFRFEDRGWILPGIYRREGSTVLLCINELTQRRPDSFETGEHQALFALHRVKRRK